MNRGIFFPGILALLGSLALNWGAGALYWAMLNFKKKVCVAAVHCCCDHHPLELALSFYISIKSEELRNRGLHLWLTQDHCQWRRAANSQWTIGPLLGMHSKLTSPKCKLLALLLCAVLSCISSVTRCRGLTYCPTDTLSLPCPLSLPCLSVCANFSVSVLPLSAASP